MVKYWLNTSQIPCIFRPAAHTPPRLVRPSQEPPPPRTHVRWARVPAGLPASCPPHPLPPLVVSIRRLRGSMAHRLHAGGTSKQSSEQYGGDRSSRLLPAQLEQPRHLHACVRAFCAFVRARTFSRKVELLPRHLPHTPAETRARERVRAWALPTPACRSQPRLRAA